MEWILAIIAFFAIAVVTQFGKKKALNERRRRIELRILKKVYEKSGEDNKENLLVVAQLLTDPEMDILLFDHDDTTNWWKTKIAKSDERSVKAMDRLVGLMEETAELKAENK